LVHYSPGWLSKVENGQAVPTVEFARACDEVLAADGQLVALARAVRPSGGMWLKPTQLPIVAAGFVGREKILAELDALWAEAQRTGSAFAVVIDGPPGAGKSTLAIQWARRTMDSFPDGVLFIDLQGYSPTSGPMETSHVLERFLTAFGVLADSIPLDLDERAALFRTLVAGRRVLVVLDNAADSRRTRHLLLGSAGCAVVVTSRRRLTGLAVTAGIRRLSVGPMSVSEALSLVRAVVGDERVDADPSAARALAQRCAYLPLALRIAGERLASHPHRPVASMVAELTDDEGRLDLLADEDDQYLAVRSVFSWSYRDLDSEVARAFRLLGLYPGIQISTSAAAVLVGHTLARTRLLLESLVAVHLLEETDMDRYRLHDLLRVYAAERAAAEETEAERLAAIRRLTDWYVHTIDAAARPLAPQRIMPPLGEPSAAVVPLEFSSAAEARQWCDAESDVFVPLARLAARFLLPAAWQIPVRLWNWLLLGKPWAVWIDSHEIGLEAAVAAGNEEGQAWVALNLGEAYRQRGSYGLAQRHMQRALSLRHRLDDRHGQAWALTALGFLATDRADIDGACTCFRQALPLFQKSADHHGQAVVLASIADAYGLLGRDQEALEAFEASLSLVREVHDVWGEGMLWERNAEVHIRRGDFSQAVQSLDRSIKCRRSVGEDWALAAVLDRRGSVLSFLGDEWRDAAQESWQQACDLFERLGDTRAALIRERINAARQEDTTRAARHGSRLD
jgi:tetratricopeptide (TPR) repeat protein